MTAICRGDILVLARCEDHEITREYLVALQMHGIVEMFDLETEEVLDPKIINENLIYMGDHYLRIMEIKSGEGMQKLIQLERAALKASA